MLLIALGSGLHYALKPQTKWDVPPETTLQAWRQWKNQRERASQTDGKASKASPQIDEEALSTFDPNTIDSARLVAFGLSEYVIRNWMRYREAGGKFYAADKLAEIYGMKAEVYEKLRPHIQIARKRKPRQNSYQNQYAERPDTRRKKGSERDVAGKSKKTPVSVYLNQADSAKWTQLYGIGPVFASRIVKYRGLIGGFYDKSQLLEVYGMDSNRLDPLWASLQLGPNPSIQKMAINDVEVKTLGRHPYLSFKDARKIVRFREQHGAFKEHRELLRIHGLNPAKVRKIQPYLDFTE